MPAFATPQSTAATLELVAVDVRIVASDCQNTAVDVRPGNSARASDASAAKRTRVGYFGGQLRGVTPRNSMTRVDRVRVRVDDTELAVTDQCEGVPVVFANGAFSTAKAWSRVLSELGASVRAVVFDMRGRGWSGTSADYALAAYERDLDAVIKSRELENPVLVGWSLGAHTVLRWAASHPGAFRGIVLIDGGYPFEWSGSAEHDRTRVMFRRQAWLLPLLAWLGMAGRMSAAQHAEVIIELNDRAASLIEAFAAIKVPINIVSASGGNQGAAADEAARMRASLDPVLAAHSNVRVFATVLCYLDTPRWLPA